VQSPRGKEDTSVLSNTLEGLPFSLVYPNPITINDETSPGTDDSLFNGTTLFWT
jgi:hypothetical protein